MLQAIFSFAVVLLPLAFAQGNSTQATGGNIPLASKRFIWPDLPYQADTGNGPRGTQQGYNICNATTQNQQSMCQTGFLNSIDEFCLWGSPTPNNHVANVEESMVAFCTKKKFGARMLTDGALQGVQFIKTPGYVEVLGFIDQTTLNLAPDDAGGEEDPHGADLRGNPLGALVYSNSFNQPGGPLYTQVIEWNYFVGRGVFCFKACDPAGPDAALLCEHVYDRVGCVYNSPANYPAIKGTFQSCKGDNQLPVGRYIEGGATKTWVQPPETLGPISTVPYTAVIPATSECTTYTSSALFTELPSPPPNPTTVNQSGRPNSRPDINGRPLATGARSMAAPSFSAYSFGLMVIPTAICAALGFMMVA